MATSGYGMFYVDKRLVREHLDMLQQLLADLQFVPTSVVTAGLNGETLLYTGLSPAFKNDVLNVDRAPLYDIIITENDAGEYDRVEAVAS